MSNPRPVRYVAFHKPASGSVLHWMRKDGFENVSSQITEHIMNVHVGNAVFRGPHLRQNATSQLALLSAEVYDAGIQKIRSVIAEAGRDEERITFRSDFSVKMYLGYKSISQEEK